MTIKNFWSLNVDEAIVADKLRTEFGKDYEVFFPVNSQLKDIDLIVYNLKTQKSISIQVKASKTHQGKKGTRKFGKPNSWSVINTSSIFNTTNKIDFIVFVIYDENLTNKNRNIIQHFLIIPMKDFQKITKKDKKERKAGCYHYSFIVDEKQVLEINNTQDKTIDFSKYLNNWKLIK
jgi:hypothetical protein